MKVEINIPESPYDGLWVVGEGYILHNDVFTKELKQDAIKIGLMCVGNDIWKPMVKVVDSSWKELVEFSLMILHSQNTRLFCNPMWLSKIPEFEIKDLEPTDLSTHSVRNTKKINLNCSWTHLNGKTEMLNKFRFSSPDPQEPALGSWLHWVAFATKILSDDNTRIVCEALYCKELEINI